MKNYAEQLMFAVAAQLRVHLTAHGADIEGVHYPAMERCVDERCAEVVRQTQIMVKRSKAVRP